MKLTLLYPRILIGLILLLSCYSRSTIGQERKYFTGNAHSHNDYNHPKPFYTAHAAGFGSIEADIFLKDGDLYVAHDAIDIQPDRTLETLYLKPLWEAIKRNGGNVYADRRRHLLLLIDVKTSAEPTLDAVVKLLEKYRQIIDCPSLLLVISGNRPSSSKWHTYPEWLYFDGRPYENYTKPALDKIGLMSDNFRNYTRWNGEGDLTEEERQKILKVVTDAHTHNKQVRFWASPDLPNAWQKLMQLDVDYINTDKIQEMADFMAKQRSINVGK